MVLLKDTIEIFDLPDFNGIPRSGGCQNCIYFLQASQIGAAFVNDDAIRSPAMQADPGARAA